MDQRRVLAWAGGVVGFFLVAGVVLLGVSLLHHGDGGGSAASPVATARASGLPTRALDVPSASAAGSATPTPPPTPDQMKNFVVQYLDTATSNQAASWASLTPRFRAASGGFGSYQGFWSGIDHADASGFVAKPADGSIAYRVTYTHRDGSTSNDVTRLHLVQTSTGFLIDAEG